MSATMAIGAALGAVLGAIGLLHLFWALRGRASPGVALPTKDGKPIFVPGPGITIVVALGLFAFAAVALTLGGLVQPGIDLEWVRGTGAVIGLIFLARAIGDFRMVGVTKRIRGTPFARWDDRLFTPLCVALCVGFSILVFGQ